MSTYAIGDVQGCYEELLLLLEEIDFDPQKDQLWFTGDLVNRGPQSLEVLRYVKKLGDTAITVLGNHDLHLLAVAFNNSQLRQKDTLNEVLAAPDCNELLDWLRNRPLFHKDSNNDFVLIHAGLPPQWDIGQAKERAAEVEAVLRSDNPGPFFDSMYGNEPHSWSDTLTGNDRLRFITNTYTRLRYCDADGNFCLEAKGPPGTQPAPFQAWFTIDSRKSRNEKIIFGHWASIYRGNITDFQKDNVYPLDTGCVWGGALTAIRLEDECWFNVDSSQPGKY